MLLCNLPEDIVAIVLGNCALDSHDATRSLKRNLPLLAVCRQWRRLAMPLVYNQTFVQYGQRPGRMLGSFTLDPNMGEPTDVAVKSNLDLIAVNGCARVVKRVQINAHFLANPFPGWREVIQRMQAVTSKWRVAELKVEMRPDSRYFDGRDVDLTRYTDDIVEVSNALAALMPGVRRLECGGTGQNPFARSLYGHLAGQYADQLQRLISEHPIAVPLDCQFTRLNELRVDADGEADYQLPQIVSGELVGMRFVSGSPNHSWAPFSTATDSRVIDFTKLKKLIVEYPTIYQEGSVAVRHRDGHPWKLHFPSLKSLHILCLQDICPLLEYAVLPPRMESIYIAMNSAAFQGIADLVPPVTKCLFLGINPSSRGDSSGLPIVNRILESARGSEILRLSIEDSMLLVVPDSITCTYLTYLKISAPTSVDTMLALIAKLPRLTQMVLSNLDLSDFQADISIPGAGEDAVVEPLSHSLKFLAINNSMRRHLPDMEAAVAVAVAKYVLLRIPTLTQLWVRQTPKDPVLSFVEEYAPHYPHLSSVELILDEGGGALYCSTGA